MKFLIVFALALAITSAFNLRGTEVKQHNVIVPVVQPESRITNGYNATPNQFPYHAGLSLRKGNFTTWCSGSLISNRWILTAAHCADGVQSVTVYLGGNERMKSEVKYTVNSSDIIVHSAWKWKTLDNDISLIQIPFTSYTPNIKSVDLPALTSSYSNYTGDKVVASGWGHTSDGSGITNKLQWAVLDVITNSKCRLTYGNIINSSKLCVAAPKGVSTCHGDSGGPLVLESTNVQVGVTSFGSSGGCEQGKDVVFTRVTSYLDWIATYVNTPQ